MLRIIIITSNTLNIVNKPSPSKTYRENIYISFFLIEGIMHVVHRGKKILKKKIIMLDLILLSVTILNKKMLGLTETNLTGFRIISAAYFLKFQPLNNIFHSLFSSLLLLLETFAILIFFVIIFALIGQKLFYEIFSNQCLDPISGMFLEDYLCSKNNCPNEYICSFNYKSMDENNTNFDTISNSLVQVFRVLTIDDWTKLLKQTQQGFSIFSWIFHVLIVFIGNFIIMNLVLAIMKLKYSIPPIKTQNSKLSLDIRLLKDDDNENPIVYGRKTNINQKSLLKIQRSFMTKETQKLNYRNFRSSLILSQNDLSLQVLTSRRLSKINRKKISMIKKTHDNFSKVKLIYMEVFVKKSQEYIDVNREDILEITLENKRKKEKEIIENDKRTSKYKYNYNTDLERIFSENNHEPTRYKPVILRAIKLAIRKDNHQISSRRIVPNWSITENLVNSTLLIDKTQRHTEFETLNMMHFMNGENNEIMPDISKFYYGWFKRKLKERIFTPEKEVIDYETKYMEILENDYKEKTRDFEIYSVFDLEIHKPSYYHFEISDCLNESLALTNIMVSEPKTRSYFISRILNSTTYNKFISLCIALTICTSAGEGLIFTKAESYYYQIGFGIFFFFELLFKVFILGFSHTFADNLNILEGYLGILTMFMTWMILVARNEFDNLENNFASWRVIEATFIFRGLRILREIPYYNYISKIVRSSIKSFVMIAILFILFILSMALIEIESFEDNDEFHIKNFIRGSIKVFGIITMDNWYSFYLEKGGKDKQLTLIFFIFTTIFIGNFVLLNLFIANMLDGFETINKSNRKKKRANYRKYNRRRRSLLATDLFSPTPNTPKADNVSERSNLGSGLSLWSITKKNTLKSFTRSFNLKKIEKVIDKTTKLAIHLVFNLIPIVTVTLDTVNSNQYMMITDSLNLTTLMYLSIELLSRIWRVLSKSIRRIESMFKFEFLFITSSWLLIFFDVITNIGSNIESRSKIFTFLRSLLIFRIIFLSNALVAVAKSLILSITKIINIIAILILIWLFYAFIGNLLYQGRFGYCELNNNFFVSKEQCLLEGKSWTIEVNNFDSIFSSFLSLMSINTYDGWNRIFTIAMNSDISTKGPSPFNNEWTTYIYFLSFTVISSMFFSNLFIGVLFKNYILSEKKHINLKLTENQSKWFTFAKTIRNTAPEKFQPSEQLWRKRIYYMFTSKSYRVFLSCVIIIHSVVMFQEKSISNEAFKIIRLLFFSFYLLELFLKVLSWGVKGYIMQHRNFTEFFLILCFSIIIMIERLALEFQNDRLVSLLELFIFFRFLQIFKLMNTFFRTLILSLPRLINLSIVIFLLTFSCSVLGWIFFSNIKAGLVIDEYTNFREIRSSMLTLLRIATAEDWRFILYDCKYPSQCYEGNDCGSSFAPIILFIYSFLFYFILLNMFVLILLNSFEDYTKNKLNPSEFELCIDYFRRSWSKFFFLPVQIRHPNRNQTILRNMSLTKGVIKYSKKIFPSIMKRNTDTANISTTVQKKSSNLGSEGQKKESRIPLKDNFIKCSPKKTLKSFELITKRFSDKPKSILRNSIVNSNEMKTDLNASNKNAKKANTDNQKDYDQSSIVDKRVQRVRKRDSRLGSLIGVFKNTKEIITNVSTMILDSFSSNEFKLNDLKIVKIPFFLRTLGQPYGLKPTADLFETMDFIKGMYFIKTSNNTTNFHQILYFVLKNYFKKEIDENSTEENDEEFRSQEERTLLSLSKQRKMMLVRPQSKISYSTPLNEMLNALIVLKVWNSYLHKITSNNGLEDFNEEDEDDEEEEEIKR